MKILSFDAWVLNNPELVAEINLQAKSDKVCRTCDGLGETECIVCGHVRECPECDGSGYTNKNPIGDVREYLRYLYDGQVEFELFQIARTGVVVGEREITNEVPLAALQVTTA